MTAQIKLNTASGGGSVSLKAPSTTTSNAAVELQLPVEDGSADTFLKTNGSGALSFAEAGGGKILQVVQEIKKNKQSIQSQTPVDIANFEATITPSATSSKILIELTLSVCCHASGLLKIWRKKGSNAYAQLTDFLGDADGNRERTTLHVGQPQTANTETRSIIILDSPNTTDEVKYKWQGYTPSHSSYVMTICGSVQDTDSDYYARPISTMTLKEVGA